MSEAPYDAVIFDMDGVIVEPTDRDVMVEAVCTAFESFGLDDHRALAERTVAEDVVPTETLRGYGVDPEAVWHARELRASLAQATHARRGGKAVYDDVSALVALDVPLGLVSNNQQATVDFLLAHHDLGYFETAHGRAQTLAGAARRKPAPYYLEAALADLDVEQALYVGDKAEDLLAAERAGIDGALLRREHVTLDDPPVEPAHELSDLDELVATVTDTPVETLE